MESSPKIFIPGPRAGLVWTGCFAAAAGRKSLAAIARAFPMSFLPIAEHELRRAVRRRSLYWVRTGAAAFATFLALAIYLGSARGWLNPTTAGRNLFQLLCPLTLLSCLLA